MMPQYLALEVVKGHNFVLDFLARLQLLQDDATKGYN